MTIEMYKTVKQGENSLQYKILAQGEEGLGHVKCKKSKKRRTVGIVTVITLLVGGVIATAVLVPLVLTDDFITLTGAFQKFSVSTLRRSHSGNHVVLIAKKPHGWDPSHQNAVQQASMKTTTTSSANHASNKSQEATTTVKEPNITTTTKATTVSEVHVKRTTPKLQKVAESGSKIEPTARPTTTEKHEAKGVNDVVRTSTPGYTLSNQKNPEVGVTLEDVPSTVHTPYWYRRQKWGFESPDSFLTRSKEAMSTIPIWIFMAIFLAAFFVISVIVVMVRSFGHRRNLIQKEATELKEDKKRLLKPSARASDEE